VRRTRNAQHIRAARPAVYAALLDPAAVARWRVPDGMSSVVHEFDSRPGGGFRVSLTYDAQDAAGKSVANTDTYHGRFAELVPDEKVVEVLEFDTDNPALQGAMTITTILSDVGDGTEVVIMHDGLPSGVALADNETGTRMALRKLAALVEDGE